MSVRRFLLMLVVGGVGLLGCQGRGSPPDVSSGTFELHVDGIFSDTLSGAAQYRANEQGIRGIELGAKDGLGVSIELEPRPPALRTYEVVETDLFGVQRPDDPPGVMAFLTLEQGQFTAVDGTFEVTYVGEDNVGAQFTFVMERDRDRRSADAASVEISGELNAPAAQ